MLIFALICLHKQIKTGEYRHGVPYSYQEERACSF
jgi:hypothetical protein